MELLPLKETLEENTDFLHHSDSREILSMTLDYYKIVGYEPPWIGYFASKEGRLVGSAGFKGRPVGGRVEIAYGTFEQFRQQGIGTEICRQLVLLSLKTAPAVRITARTLPENNFSTRILEKNGFRFLATVHDEEDGDVWEWEYMPGPPR